MKFASPARTRMKRLVVRAPIWLYRLGLGGLLGDRFVLLTHRGRISGKERQVVLEVVGRHRDYGYLVASGYGSRAQWFCNILAQPRIRFQIGRRQFVGRAGPLPPEESGRMLRQYARFHPRTAAALMHAIGQDVDGSEPDYERIGADRERGVPVVALRPD